MGMDAQHYWEIACGGYGQFVVEIFEDSRPNEETWLLAVSHALFSLQAGVDSADMLPRLASFLTEMRPDSLFYLWDGNDSISFRIHDDQLAICALPHLPNGAAQLLEMRIDSDAARELARACLEAWKELEDYLKL